MQFPIAPYAVLLPLLCGTLSAQIVSVPDSNAKTGTANLVPLGGKGGLTQDIRTQILVPARYFPSTGSTIKDLAFAAANTGTYRYTRFELRIGYLPKTRNGELSKVFAQNLVNSAVLLDKTSFTYAFPAADKWHRVGLTKTFKHDGKTDIVVDVIVRGAFFNGSSPGSRRSSKLKTVISMGYKDTKTSGGGPYDGGAKLQFVLTNGSLGYFGTGCKSSNSKVPDLELDSPPALGLRTKAIVKDVPSKLPVLLLFGTSDRKYLTLNLPFKLDGAGAAGCSLRTDILLILPGAATAAGRAEIPLVFPSDRKFAGQQVTMQGAVLDPKANSFGLSFSRMARAKL